MWVSLSSFTFKQCMEIMVHNHVVRNLYWQINIYIVCLHVISVWLKGTWKMKQTTVKCEFARRDEWKCQVTHLLFYVDLQVVGKIFDDACFVIICQMWNMLFCNLKNKDFQWRVFLGDRFSLSLPLRSLTYMILFFLTPFLIMSFTAVKCYSRLCSCLKLL